MALVAEEITGDRAKAIAYYERILGDRLRRTSRRSARSTCSTRPSSVGTASRSCSSGGSQGAIGDDRLELAPASRDASSSRGIGDAAGALSYLEQVLRERPAAAEARQLVEKILDVPELRSRAAIVLEAVYTERDEVPDLVRVLEIHLEFAEGPDERRDLLRRVAELRDERLRDDAGAFDAFARLLPLDPDDPRARQRMLEIARRLERSRARCRGAHRDGGRGARARSRAPRS